MRRFQAVAWLAALTLMLASGCSTYQQAKRTTIDEPLQYSVRKDRIRSLRTYRAWADAAWLEASAACDLGPDADLDAYAMGFRDGFVDLVYAGGTGEPPPVPPRMFWNVPWRSPRGHAAVDDWYAGYRHGARVARDGGFRQQAIVQTSLPFNGEVYLPPLQGPALSAPPEDLGPTPSVTPVPDADPPAADEPLPQPLIPPVAPEMNPENTPTPQPSPEPSRSADAAAQKFKAALAGAASRRDGAPVARPQAAPPSPLARGARASGGGSKLRVVQ